MAYQDFDPRTRGKTLSPPTQEEVKALITNIKQYFPSRDREGSVRVIRGLEMRIRELLLEVIDARSEKGG